MRARLWIVCAMAVLAACAPTRDSGIEGRITAAPTCPVVRVDVPCPDEPYAGTISIKRENGWFTLATVTADSMGYYRVILPPGTYVLHPESPSVMPHASDLVVDVLPHQFTHQDIVYDTGIR